MAWETDRLGNVAEMPRITYDWVERHLLPALRELSRRGIIVSYDSGIEPRSKGKEREEPPTISGNPRKIKALTDAQTSLFTLTVKSGEMVSGRIIYAIRASDGTDHQALVGEVFFAIVNKGGTFTTTPGTTGIMPDTEVYAASAGTLSTLWVITTSGSVATIKVTPSGSLTEITYGIEYTVDVFPNVVVTEV